MWRTISLAFVLGGLSVLAVTLGADLNGISQHDGFGPHQRMVAACGVVVFLLGVVLDSTFARRDVWNWFRVQFHDRQTLIKMLVVTLQLGLLVLIMAQFRLESPAFYGKIMILVFFGFLIHHFLPSRYRLPFFVALSFTGISTVFGLLNAAWLIGIGLLMIGMCHLPISIAARVVVLLLVGLLLTALRAGIWSTPWSKAIWPILGSMFMFRLVIYMYDLSHNKAPISPARVLAYFFLLPNVAFPLFPAVDYSTFCRTHYNDEPMKIYQKGLQWMFWGISHLIAYRWINYYVVIAPEEVTSMSSLIRYMISNYALILRVSGQFHLIIGILHLFGFNLPRIMHLYFLADSFSDYWRRVNIYWKEFIQKVFYFPIYFRLRNWGNTSKLIAATAIGFAITWFFHAYQWFWIRGSFLLSTPDILFWSCLGLLVVGNSLYESKFGRKRSLSKQSWSVSEIASRTLRTAGVFVTITILWSLWISPSVSEWIALLAGANVTVPGVVGALAAVVSVIFIAVVLLEFSSTNQARESTHTRPFYLSVAYTGVPMFLLLLVGRPEVYSRLGGEAGETIRDLRTARLSRRDTDLLTRGYYEDLASVNRFNLELWEIYAKRPDEWPILRETEAGRTTRDFLVHELAPLSTIVFHGEPLSTNRWGMRDKDYSREKTPGTYRMALFGGSFVLGSGVADGEPFESLLEKRLNVDHAGYQIQNYEILNFAVGAYCTFQHLVVLERKALSFQPDAIILSSHPREIKNNIRHLVDIVRDGVEIPYDQVREIVARAGIDSNTPEADAFRRLRPFGNELLMWAYQRFTSACHEQGVLPIYIYFPVLQPKENDPSVGKMLTSLAGQCGFCVLDISDVYKDQDIESLRVADWDWHPNAKAHKLLADSIYNALCEERYRIAIPLGETPQSKSQATSGKTSTHTLSPDLRS